VYYVQICEVSEDLFWNADLNFLNQVVENKQAFDDWRESIKEHIAEREARHAKRAK
jgi:hypothetical protein